MATDKQTILIEIEVQKKAIEAINLEIQALRKERQELNKELKKSDEDLKKEGKTREQLNKNLIENEKQRKELNKLLRENSKNQEINERIIKSAEGSYDQLSAQLSKSKKEWKALSEEERNSDLGKLSTKNLKVLNDKLKGFDKTVGVTSRSVGDYKEQVKEALNESGLFGNIMPKISQGLNIAKKSTISLKTALVALPIFAIVAAFTALVQWFKRTQEGQEKLRIITAALGAAFDVVMNKVTDLGKIVFETFTKIATTTQNVVNWFKRLGGATDEVAESTEEADDKEKGFLETIRDQAKAAADLEKARINLTKTNRELELSVAQLNKQQELLAQSAEDDTKSFNDQREAAEQLAVVLEKKANKEFQIARNNLKLIQDEIALRKVNGLVTDDLLDQQLQAQQALIDAETNYLTTKENNEIVLRKIARDRFEQDLDILIDIGDSRKTQLERQLTDENLTNEQRQKLLNQATIEQERAFQQQIKLFEDYTGQRIDFNSLLAEDDLNVLNDRLQNDFDFNEITINRLRETLIERRASIQDIADLEKEIEKKKQEEILEQKRLQAEEENVILLEKLANEQITREEYDQILLEQEITKNQAILDNTLSTDEQILEARKWLAENTIAEIEKETQADLAAKAVRVAATKEFLDAGLSLFKKNTIAYKALALREIAIDTGKAISKLTVASEGNIFNSVTAGGAGIIQFATGLIRIFANIAQAKQVISGVGFYTGGYTGDGGKYVPAGIVHKGEVVWSQEDVAAVGGANIANSMRPTYVNGGIVGQNFASSNISSSRQSIKTKEVFVPVLITEQLDDVRAMQGRELQIETN